MNKAGSILSFKNTENKISANKISEEENKINENPSFIGKKDDRNFYEGFCFVLFLSKEIPVENLGN